MKRLSNRLIAALVCGVALSWSLSAAAAPGSLDELLQQVKRIKSEEAKENAAREAAFVRDKERQQQLLQDARAKLAAEEARADALRSRFDENEKKLAEMEETLQQRQGNLGELFGVVRQVAGDTAGVVSGSLVSSQYPDREDALIALGKEKDLPSIEQLEGLWFALQQEMTESGKVVQFQGAVVSPEGVAEPRKVTRVGVFNAVSDGKFLRYISETGQLVELSRQPQPRFLAMAAGLEGASGEMVPMALDPSRGSILSMLVQAPDLVERVAQGREIGYIIIVLAIVGLLVAVYRLFDLSIMGLKVRSQLKHDDQPKRNNPLGRVLSVYHDNPDVDLETLERRLDEAIIKETPRVQRGLSIIKILAVVAPLLGLLGTVTGMIQTFQSITLFGTGDPKLMAGGISQALVTTVLGLMAAIPLTFLHALVASRSRNLVQVLDEQSAGIIARHAIRRKAER